MLIVLEAIFLRTTLSFYGYPHVFLPTTFLGAFGLDMPTSAEEISFLEVCHYGASFIVQTNNHLVFRHFFGVLRMKLYSRLTWYSLQTLGK
jgi:hypothetical protein